MYQPRTNLRPLITDHQLNFRVHGTTSSNTPYVLRAEVANLAEGMDDAKSKSLLAVPEGRFGWALLGSLLSPTILADRKKKENRGKNSQST